MVVKKGYFYLIEILLVTVIIIFFFFSLPYSEKRHQGYEETESMKAIGYGTLLSLDKQGIFDEYISRDINRSNFTILKESLESSIETADIAKIEYMYSNASKNYSEIICLNSTGKVTSCGEVQKRTKEKLVSLMYTYSTICDPVTIKLYLRRYSL